MDECGKTIFETHCKGEFESISNKLDKLNKKLFEDNGTECIQTKLNRQGDFIKRLTIAGAAVWTIIVVVLGWLLSKI